MDVTDVKLPTESFDGALFSFNGFESILTSEKQNAALASIFGVLKPGAYFILTARSGIAFGRRWVAWAWMLFRQLVLKPLGSSNPNLRLGDFYRKGMLQHYISPFSLKRDIRRQGFTLELFVGSSTLDRGRRATSFTNFFPDRCFFNVLKKLTSLRQ